ncbi:glycosyltransferase family 4 protein [Candidatus Woesearchaeota archaeon]|nr:glycosyltransferase family 4 protein [Candidatus Woesearchaeota archaeon]
MRVLMFGWEFPPFNSGGLGTACYGLVRGLSVHQVQVTLVLPFVHEDMQVSFARLLSTNEMATIAIKSINTLLSAYMTQQEYYAQLMKKPGHLRAIYGSNLFEEVERYSKQAEILSVQEDFDLIHCHDWMTFRAGMAAKAITGRPLIVHVHATEFDRSGGQGINKYVYDLERAGMEAADAIIAVSGFTKQKIVQHYGIASQKIMVVHNAVEHDVPYPLEEYTSFAKKHKIVLFLGRVTLQKGPDYFLQAAKKVLEQEPDTKFIIAGSGDMYGKMVEMAASLGLGDCVLFTGFLRGEDIQRAYTMADVYVMPSVSEPFGITPLEAMKHKTPVIISKQSGVSEIVHHCLKVDFWDVDVLAAKIIAVLRYPPLHQTLRDEGHKEVKKRTWEDAAAKCLDVYGRVLH